MNRPFFDDLDDLRRGLPPQDPQLVSYLSVPNRWMSLMKSYCLDQVVANGGSKVKILYGSQGMGKSHFLRELALYGRENGFFCVEIDLGASHFRLTDLVALYRVVASQLDLHFLKSALSDKLVRSLGYTSQQWKSHGGSLQSFLCDYDRADMVQARRQIRSTINGIANTLELDFAFRKFLCVYMEAIADQNPALIELAESWLQGNKISRTDKSSSLLYETLTKQNARIWLYSLSELNKVVGYKGMLLLIDQLEMIMPKASGEIRYTGLARNNTYELFRQLIDDLDFFKNILILISGDREIIENEKFGLQSYHALWMRVQPGFEQDSHINVYSDLIDADLIYKELIDDADLIDLNTKLKELGVFEQSEELQYKMAAIFGSFREMLTQNKQVEQAEQ